MMAKRSLARGRRSWSKAQDLLGGAAGMMLGIAIARAPPRRFGYWLVARIARFMAWRRNTLFCIIRGNLAHILPVGISPQELDAAAERVIYHAGRGYYDMFRAGVDDYVAGRAPIRHDAAEWELALEVLHSDRGAVLVGPHVGNFDLAAQWITAQGVEMQALSLAEPTTGNRIQNWLRRRRGIIVTPIGVSALRLAVARLRKGGVVLTGVDRPVAPDDEPVPLFGTPARLPDGHVRLAMQANVPVLVASCTLEPDGCWMLHVAPPLEMERTGDREGDIRRNVRRVLAVVEDLIRMAPDQWLMFVPVWDEPARRCPPEQGTPPR